MRAVFDTNILVRAFSSSISPARRLLDSARSSGGLVLVISPYLLDETERVLLRRAQGSEDWLTRRMVVEFVQALPDIAEIVVPVGGGPAVPGDPKDDAILQLAIAGQADVLCTRDRHFSQAGVLEVCGLHGVRVMDDVELLLEL